MASSGASPALADVIAHRHAAQAGDAGKGRGDGHLVQARLRQRHGGFLHLERAGGLVPRLLADEALALQFDRAPVWASVRLARACASSARGTVVQTHQRLPARHGLPFRNRCSGCGRPLPAAAPDSSERRLPTAEMPRAKGTCLTAATCTVAPPAWRAPAWTQPPAAPRAGREPARRVDAQHGPDDQTRRHGGRRLIHRATLLEGGRPEPGQRAWADRGDLHPLRHRLGGRLRGRNRLRRPAPDANQRGA